MEKIIITKTDYVNFIGRNANAAWCACDDRRVYELCIYIYLYIRAFLRPRTRPTLRTGFVLLLFIYYFFFFGNNHGRVRVRACMCNNMRRLPSLSRVGQWSGVQQVNKLDARARCWWSRRDGRRRRKKALFYHIIYVTCVYFFRPTTKTSERWTRGVELPASAVKRRSIGRLVVARKRTGRWEGTMAWRRRETDIIIIL